jgi:hypothetical protein
MIDGGARTTKDGVDYAPEAAMLVELTPDECRFLLGLLNEQLGEVRTQIHNSEDEHCVQELKGEEIRLERIVHRLTAAHESEHKRAG